MCSPKRYTCILTQTNKPTNKPTDKAKTICFRYRLGDIKIISLRTVIVDRRTDRWKKESERHQPHIVSIYMLPFDRLIKCYTPRKKHRMKTTCFHYIHIDKTAPPTGGHVFSPILTISELVRDTK
ncbi:hypothetical protein DPMN_181264 [Dreissena polymorpha]|uniref:Uncharacterized protein n=1 Tax=Dreissena polymorpha TaxID=45954 RepID=A0A9D4I552_DREPO|nr:hypothetical protein DPMN_181264 [Dreissena polymorpha]